MFAEPAAATGHIWTHNNTIPDLKTFTTKIHRGFRFVIDLFNDTYILMPLNDRERCRYFLGGTLILSYFSTEGMLIRSADP